MRLGEILTMGGDELFELGFNHVDAEGAIRRSVIVVLVSLAYGSKRGKAQDLRDVGLAVALGQGLQD